MVMLAHVYDEDKYCVGGWYWSEKFDGIRAIWEPDTVGVDTEYNNRRYKATGLWSRSGKMIFAPESFTANLPDIRLDGELIGPGSFQQTSSIVRSYDSDWSDIQYKVFELPGVELEYRRVYKQLVKLGLNHVEQSVIPFFQSEKYIAERLEEVVDRGGEGLMLRAPGSVYENTRSRNLLKVKPVRYGTGLIVGKTPGKGKYRGMLGALIVEWEGKTFKLSGMTDALRANPPSGTVTFKYRELSDGGVPKEARYHERHSD